MLTMDNVLLSRPTRHPTRASQASAGDCAVTSCLQFERASRATPDAHSLGASEFYRSVAMGTTRVLVLLVLSCTVLSCKKATSVNLAGRYTAERPHGFELLELGTNGTYVQIFTNTSLARTNLGQWTFQQPILTLKGALMFDDGFGHPATPIATNDWQLKPRYLFNIWVLEDRQNEPFSQVTPENQ